MSGLKIETLSDYAQFTDFAGKLPERGPKVCFFFKSEWCPSCQIAEPVVKEFLKEVNKEGIFAFVDVGSREYWKDKACPFRTDPRCKLMVIPTIIVWKGVQRLEGSQCKQTELLQMLFEDEVEGTIVT